MHRRRNAACERPRRRSTLPRAGAVLFCEPRASRAETGAAVRARERQSFFRSHKWDGSTGTAGLIISRMLDAMRMRSGVLAAVLLLFACQYDPFAHEFTTSEPRESALVGRYTPDAETTERLRSVLSISVSPAAALVINADHTFTAHDLPNCWISQSFDCAAGTEAWAGTWSLRRHQEWWSIQLHITSRNGRSTSYGLPAMLRGDGPSYLIHLTIGDPDSGNAVAFERR
jgi:hypothetical protein